MDIQDDDRQNSLRKQISTIPQYKSIKQFISSIKNEASLDEDEKDVADSIYDFATHFIEITGNSD